MICVYCAVRIASFEAGRIVEVLVRAYGAGAPGQRKTNRENSVACRDVDACNLRVAENERRRNSFEGTPDPDCKQCGGSGRIVLEAALSEMATDCSCRRNRNADAR